MPYSIVTSRGQTTIPKFIRLFLRLRPLDKILYVIDKGRVILEPVSGDILELKGTVKAPKGPTDFKRLRQQTKKKITQKALKELT